MNTNTMTCVLRNENNTSVAKATTLSRRSRHFNTRYVGKLRAIVIGNVSGIFKRSDTNPLHHVVHEVVTNVGQPKSSNGETFIA